MTISGRKISDILSGQQLTESLDVSNSRKKILCYVSTGDNDEMKSGVGVRFQTSQHVKL
jgi:hypothetical protein